MNYMNNRVKSKPIATCILSNLKLRFASVDCSSPQFVGVVLNAKL